MRLTESDLHRIVKESVNRLIQENYAARHFSQQLSEIAKSFIEFKKQVDKYYAENPEGFLYIFPEQKSKNYSIKISLKPFFGKDTKIPLKYRRDKEYYINIQYDNEKDDNFVGGFYNPRLLHKKGIQIQLNVPSKATYEDIYPTLEHEVTHLIDDLIRECKGYTYYLYIDNQMQYAGLPKYARMLLYGLWTTTEFNAWQASYRAAQGDKDWLEIMMTYLTQAYESNDEDEWNNIQEYLVSYWNNNASIIKRRGKSPRKSPLAFKKYFINTTFKKLKQMVKKYY